MWASTLAGRRLQFRAGGNAAGKWSEIGCGCSCQSFLTMPGSQRCQQAAPCAQQRPCRGLAGLLVWLFHINWCVQTARLHSGGCGLGLPPPLYSPSAILRSVFTPSLHSPAVSLDCICWKGVATLWSRCARAQVRLLLFLVWSGNATNITGVSYASVAVLIKLSCKLLKPSMFIFILFSWLCKLSFN